MQKRGRKRTEKIVKERVNEKREGGLPTKGEEKLYVFRFINESDGPIRFAICALRTSIKYCKLDLA